MDFIVDTFTKGGFILWLIAAFSVFGLAIFLERLTALKRDKILPQNVLDRVTQLVNDKKIDEAIEVSSLQKTGIGRLIRELLEHRAWSKTDLRAHIEDIGRQETQKLSQNVGVLGIIASVCPLMGLLGTVYGMIRTFSVIEQVGIGQATQLAGGISMALYTTAAGLTVAIPALIGFKFINAKVAKLSTSMEDYATNLMEKI